MESGYRSRDDGELVLVDAMVLIEAARRRSLESLLQGNAIGIVSGTLRQLEKVEESSAKIRVGWERLVKKGALTVVDCTVSELERVLRVIPKWRLAMADVESLALVVSRGWVFCTDDVRARQAGTALSIENRIIPSFKLGHIKSQDTLQRKSLHGV